MGLKDTMQGFAQTAKDTAQTQIQASREKRALQAQARERAWAEADAQMQAQRQAQAQFPVQQQVPGAQAQLAGAFHATKHMGDLVIDSDNRLFKVKHASARVTKKPGMGMMAVKGIAAMTTLGATAALEYAMNPNRVFSFDDLIGYELIEDDAAVTSGGVGAALVGGLLFGAAGGVAGAVVGGKKSKGVVENLILQIKVSDLKTPSLMITFISKRTKKKSGAYRSALSAAHETMACLDYIIRDVDQRKSSSMWAQQAPVAPQYAQAPVAQQVPVAQAPTAEPAMDVASQLERLASLYERGMLTADEFAAQKARILGA